VTIIVKNIPKKEKNRSLLNRKGGKTPENIS